MLPLVAAGLISGGGAAIKGLIGASQKRKANQISSQRPVYNIPDEIKQNRNMYQNLAGSTRLPGQSILENNIGAAGAGSINAAMQAGSGSDVLAAISSINQNQNNSYNDLAVQGAQFQSMNQDKLANANSQLAEYKDQAFDFNENQPYELRMARKNALEGAAYGNFDSALNDVAGFGSAVAMNGGMGGGKEMNAAWGGSTGKSPLVGAKNPYKFSNSFASKNRSPF